MSRGLQRERDLVRKLRDEGWWAMRSPASKGCVDVVAIRYDPMNPWRSFVRFIEVKSTVTPYSHFGPTCREDLKAEAIEAGADAELAWWPKNGKLTMIPSEDWP